MQLAHPNPITAALIASLALLPSAGATATSVPQNHALQLARGAALAEAKCSLCHAVSQTGQSPAAANADTPFHRLHERYPIAMLEEAARTGIISGHDEMPGFEFSMADIAALLAYIDSLSPAKPGYVKR